MFSKELELISFPRLGQGIFMITQILLIHVPLAKTVLFWEFLVLFTFKYHVLFIKHLSIKKHSVEPALWPPFGILVMPVGDTGCLATHPRAAPFLSVLLPFVRAVSLVLATNRDVSQPAAKTFNRWHSPAFSSPAGPERPLVETAEPETEVTWTFVTLWRWTTLESLSLSELFWVRNQHL